MSSANRRGLVGLPRAANPPTTPIERLTFLYDGVTHQACKQQMAGCVNGIDNWWLESTCGIRVVTTMLAVSSPLVDCMSCLALADQPQ